MVADLVNGNIEGNLLDALIITRWCINVKAKVGFVRQCKKRGMAKGGRAFLSCACAAILTLRSAFVKFASAKTLGAGSTALNENTG